LLIEAKLAAGFSFQKFCKKWNDQIKKFKNKKKQNCGARLQFEKNCWKLAPAVDAGEALTR
jgi:hypothetical protein